MQIGSPSTPDLKPSAPWPVLFLGHGSPMNAITPGPFPRFLNQLGQKLGRPQAILCFSAHWLTEPLQVTHMRQPRTIHDFYGFPKELFEVQYSAPGHPQLAELIQTELKDLGVVLDDEDWGLDHGTWSVLRHLYPKADVPVVQLSLNVQESPEFHFDLGARLAFLRKQGVLLVGSGNVVHNLRTIKWGDSVPAYDWAIEFDAWVKAQLQAKNWRALQKDFHQSEAGRLSIPTLEHYFPLLPILGASDTKDSLRIEYEEMQNASISMLSFSLGD